MFSSKLRTIAALSVLTCRLFALRLDEIMLSVHEDRNITTDMDGKGEAGSETSGANKCTAGVHTYINMGDGGCFIHLTSRGHFPLQGEHASTYASKYCPFAGSSTDDTKKRRLMVKWYTATTQSGNVDLDKLAEQNRGSSSASSSSVSSSSVSSSSTSAQTGGIASAPPFAVSDVARACILGENLTFNKFYRTLGISGSRYSVSVFCDAMLSLPVMFDAIGFDGPGILLEDSRSVPRWSFRGDVKTTLPSLRPGPYSGCPTSLVEDRRNRLVLRAMLPSYYHHVYTDTKIADGFKTIFSPYWSAQNFHAQLEEVCQTVIEGNIDAALSSSHLRRNGLLNDDVMQRDVFDCKRRAPCNYREDTCVCSTPGYSKYSRINGGCYKDTVEDNIIDAARCERGSCKCHKAMCWYFTEDFKATFAEFEHIVACQNLIVDRPIS